MEDNKKDILLQVEDLYVQYDTSEGTSYAVNGISSVSYTHLDVYKRQGLYHCSHRGACHRGILHLSRRLHGGELEQSDPGFPDVHRPAAGASLCHFQLWRFW